MTTRNRKKKAAASRRQALPNLHAYWPPYSIINTTAGEKHVAVVAFDFDEVIASWITKFAEHAKKMYPQSNLDPARQLYYHPGFDPSVNMTPREFEHCFDTFLPLARGGYGDLELIGDIKSQMQQIADAGIRIKIITHVPGPSSLSMTDQVPVHTGTARRVRMEMIKAMELPIESENDVEFISPHDKRGWMARNYVPLLIEDSIANAASAAEWGLAVLLVPTSYNRGFKCPNVKRLSNRNQLAQSVIEFYGELADRDLLRY
jgi:hypothetical protein